MSCVRINTFSIFGTYHSLGPSPFCRLNRLFLTLPFIRPPPPPRRFVTITLCPFPDFTPSQPPVIVLGICPKFDLLSSTGLRFAAPRSLSEIRPQLFGSRMLSFWKYRSHPPRKHARALLSAEMRRSETIREICPSYRGESECRKLRNLK